MKITRLIVDLVEIDMMNYLTLFSSSYSTMLPHRLSFTFRALPLRSHVVFVRDISLLNAGIGSRRWVIHLSPDRLHDLSFVQPKTGGHRPNLFLIRKQRIAVQSVHQVVPHTHTLGGDRSLTIHTRTPNRTSSPTVVGRTIFLYSFVVHEAISVSRVFPITAVDGTFSIKFRSAHSSIIK